jgi:PAS domain S-box-containing protein
MDTRTASPEASLVMSVFERLPVGVLVVDSELHIVGYNKTWTDYIEKFAASPATWLEAGRRLDEGGPTLSGICQRVIDGLDEVCAEGIELITKTGPTYWDVTCRPLGQRGSEDFRVLLTAVDATERVEARGLAREREAQFRRIFETTPDAIIIAEPVSGQIIDANDAACVMHGYTRDEFIGMDSRQLLHPDSYALIETYFGTVLGGGVFRTREMATLVEVSRDLTSTLEPLEILSRTLDRLRDVLGCSGSSLLLMGETEVTILAARGLAIDQLPTAGLEPSDLRFSAETLRPISDAMQRDGAVIIDDVYGEGELAAAFRNASGAYLKTVLSPIRAWMCVPLLRNEQLIGVLAASSLEPAFFQSDHARLATGFAGQVAVALETARLFEEAERRAHDMESLSRVASVLQLDEPVHRVLDRLASRATRDRCWTVAPACASPSMPNPAIR